MTRRLPTPKELAEFISVETDPARRTQMESWYWALTADGWSERRPRWWRDSWGEYGQKKAADFQWEYEWLKEQATRLELAKKRPALGAFPRWKTRFHPEK